jgi:hypothetical protein
MVDEVKRLTRLVREDAWLKMLVSAAEPKNVVFMEPTGETIKSGTTAEAYRVPAGALSGVCTPRLHCGVPGAQQSAVWREDALNLETRVKASLGAMSSPLRFPLTDCHRTQRPGTAG